MKYMTAWINGQFLPFESAKLSIADSGLVHGDAVTEMLRTFGHRPFRVSEHLSRFRHSLTESLLECHYSDEELASIIQEVVSRSAKHLEADRDLGVILFTSSGSQCHVSRKLRRVQADSLCAYISASVFIVAREPPAGGNVSLFHLMWQSPLNRLTQQLKVGVEFIGELLIVE